jgi:FAD:protein FMN transferase
MRSHYIELCRARPLLGTIVEITVRSDQVGRTQEAVERAFAEISTVQQQMSFHDSASVLSRLNRQAFSRPVKVDKRTFAVLEKARELHQLSDGLFDPTIAPELERAGFLPDSNMMSSQVGVSFADVELLDGNRVRFGRPGIRLDLGGLAKGYAVDRAVSVLRQSGVDSGLVNAGGDLRAFGTDSFMAEIRDPSQPGKMVARCPVRDFALATSAHYFADRTAAGPPAGPFVHPRTRRLQGNLLSVTVAAGSAILADALTKVVMLNPPEAPLLLQRLGAAALIIDPNNSLFCTPSWHETIQAAA